jgi:hypothetical protein
MTKKAIYLAYHIEGKHDLYTTAYPRLTGKLGVRNNM